MEDDTTQNKMKGEGMINYKFNIIIVINIIIIFTNVEVPLIIKKNQSTILKEGSRRTYPVVSI